MVSKIDIISALKDLDLEQGDKVIVHSSLKSLGHVTGGPETVIQALQETVTCEGILMMPSFNHGLIFYKKKQPVPDACFDVIHTHTTNGLIPETFRKMKGVFRSLNPTHAFAVWGKNAEMYVKNHHRLLTMGQGSPLELLERNGGKCLFIGVGYAPNTFKHVVEMTNNVPCLSPRTDEHNVRLEDGRVVKGRTWGWRKGECPLPERTSYEDIQMKTRGLDKRALLGKAQLTLFCLSDFRAVLEDVLEFGLNGIPGCANCKVKAEITAFAKESDWDIKRGCLKEWSPALEY
jgi:aminoglycoside 3-N-acetyltransferase